MTEMNHIHSHIINSPEKADEWLSKYAKSYDPNLKGTPVLIGIGGAGSNFISRCIDDGFHKELPTVYITRDPQKLIRSKAAHNVFIEEAEGEGIEQLVPLLERFLSIHIDTAFIVCGLGGSSGDYALKAAEMAKSHKMRSIITGYSPFRFEPNKTLNQAQSAKSQLQSSAFCDQFYEVNNSEVLDFTDSKAHMPDVCALIDEPIRKYVDFLVGETRSDDPYDPIESYLHTEEINAIIDDLKSAVDSILDSEPFGALEKE